MITISRATDASYAPIPLIVETDQGSWQLSVPGPLNYQKVPGHRVYRVYSPAEHMFLITLVACDREYDLASVGDVSDIEGITAITITDGFLWNQSQGWTPSITYRGVTNYNGYPELNGAYYIGVRPWNR